MKKLLYILGATSIAAMVFAELHAQTTTTPQIIAAACAYNSSPPAITSGTFALVQCNSTGAIKGGP